MSVVRTHTHSYPRAEINAMEAAYGGKRCIYTLGRLSIHWSHQLDSATERLEWMLQRNLREDRHPAHPAEVRESIVPVDATLHGRSDSGVPSLTIYPHEDILAKALEYELDVAALRQSAVRAGNADPGRPPYLLGYGVSHIGLSVDCRVHIPSRLNMDAGILRFDNGPDAPPTIYHPRQCPGIGLAGVQPFRVIHTLLSLPFSLLHQAPRLASMAPLTQYQVDVLRIGEEVMRLWAWDPVASGPQGAVVPASSDVFQGLTPVASRTTTFQSIWSRIDEARTFRGRPAPPPAAGDSDAGSDFDGEAVNVCSNESSSSSSGFWEMYKTPPFVGGTTNDMLMARGHLDPGVYVQYMHVNIGAEEGGADGSDARLGEEEPGALRGFGGLEDTPDAPSGGSAHAEAAGNCAPGAPGE